MQAHHPYRHLLAHFEIFWDILRHLEKIGAIFSNFEQFGAVFVGPVWVISSNFEHFCRASLGHVEQFGTVFGNTIWHCRPWTVFKMSQLRLLWDSLLWLKKVADVNPTDLDPKTRSVSTYIYNNNYYYIYIIMCVYIYIFTRKMRTIFRCSRTSKMVSKWVVTPHK